MTADFDVAARLAAGRPSVERVEIYVSACRRLGFQHPDLTTRAGQVGDWYGREEGLDLRAVEADRAALTAATAAADAAVARHAELLAELGGAWSGRGAGAARDFLEQHRRSALAVRDGLHRAAEAIATLRDELWRSVDAKVAAVLAIDDRRLARHADWQAAAQTVTTGAGDMAAASELVDQQVKPFVAGDIGSDWLAAMRRTEAAVTAAYDDAVARMAAGTAATFDVPGELGPSWAGEPESPLAATAPAAPVATVPAATVPAAAPAVVMPPPAVATAPPPASTPAPMLAAPMDPLPASSMPSLGDLGGGMPGVGGVGGFGQQLADLLGGLLGSSQDAVDAVDPGGDSPKIDPPDATVDAADPDPETGDTADESDPEDDPKEVTEAGGEEQDSEPEPAPEPEPAAPEPGPEPEPAPESPPAAAEALPAERTPCEIAADELPQVGE